MSRKIGAGVDPDQSSANPRRGSLLPQDQRKLGRYPHTWIMGEDPDGVLLRRAGRRRSSGINMTVRCADDCFAAEEFAEEGCFGVAWIGVELNRDIGRSDLAEIDRHRERPGFAVTGEARFPDVKPRPVPTQSSLPTLHRPCRLTPCGRAAAQLGRADEVILLDIIARHSAA